MCAGVLSGKVLDADASLEPLAGIDHPLDDPVPLLVHSAPPRPSGTPVDRARGAGSLPPRCTGRTAEWDDTWPISTRIALGRAGRRDRPPVLRDARGLVVRARIRRHPAHPVPVTRRAGHRARASAALADAARAGAERRDCGLLRFHPGSDAILGLHARLAALSVTALTDPTTVATRDGATTLTHGAGVVPDA